MKNPAILVRVFRVAGNYKAAQQTMIAHKKHALGRSNPVQGLDFGLF